MNQTIIIIGSGPSGIAAATKLIELGYQNVIILEAENRIGGRIWTIPFGENVLDLGAQWCHGEKDNVVYKTATKYQNDIFDSTKRLYENFNCIKSNREIVPKEIIEKISEIVDEIADSDESDKILINYKGSFGEFLNKRFYEELQKPENYDLDKKIARQFLDFYQKFECSLDACDTVFDISASGFLQYWECDGDMLLNWKGKGYITILKILMSSTEEKPYGILENKIFLNRKVEEISWTRNDEGKIFVKCSDGEKLDADHVICTVSLGALKEKHSTLFNPQLPALKLRAIEGLGFGNVDKLFLEFPQPFWPDESWPGFCLLWEENDLKKIREEGNDNWIEDVFGFYRVDYQPNVLCAWICGANGRRMEACIDDDVLNGLMYLLRKFLPWNIPKPKNFIRSKWYLNQNFRGSYSFRSMRTDEMNTNAADLAYPLTDRKTGLPILQFAGEATHDHYYSTVHGAIESGWREANRLNDFYSNNHITLDYKQFSTTTTNGNSHVFNNDDNNANIFDVIILGGGLAGLGAGYCLKQFQEKQQKQHQQESQNSSSIKKSNLKFIILEAQDYIGGRVRTVHMKPKISSSNSFFPTTTTTTIDNSGNGGGVLNADYSNDGFGNLHDYNHFSNDNIIDSGAQWLHGENNNLYRIAEDYNLLRSELSEEGLGSYICDNGKILDENFRQNTDFKIRQILEDCEKFANFEENGDDSYPENVGKYYKEKFDEYLQQEFDNDATNDEDDTTTIYKRNEDKENASRLYDWHKRFEIIDNSCLNLEQLSAKYWGLYSYNGENCQAHINVKNGFSTIIQALCTNINEKNIQTQTEICDINWNIINKSNKNLSKNKRKKKTNCDGRSNLKCNQCHEENLNDDKNDYDTENLSNNDDNEENINDDEENLNDDDNGDCNHLISIQTNDKRIYYAKHIIITFSLGVLKSIEYKLFTPKLPNHTREAIHCIGFETINKIFLQFANAWWHPMKGIQLLFSDDSYENCKWTRHISGFDVLSPGAPNTLVAWVGSYGAVEMQQLTDEEIIRDCMDLLTKFTKRKIPYPIQYYCSRWGSNKFICGGYSFLSTKCDKTNITGQDLSIPITLNDLKSLITAAVIPTDAVTTLTKTTTKNYDEHLTKRSFEDMSFINSNKSGDNGVGGDTKNEFSDSLPPYYPLILFAGEACHEKYFSTAHGAFESGYEQAEKLLNFYSLYQ